MGFLYNDISATFAAEDRTKNKIIGFISYLPFLFFVSFVLSRRSPLAKFNAMQGMLLSALLLIVSLIARLFWILAYPLSFVAFIVFIMMIYAAFKSLKGAVIEYPVLGMKNPFK